MPVSGYQSPSESSGYYSIPDLGTTKSKSLPDNYSVPNLDRAKRSKRQAVHIKGDTTVEFQHLLSSQTLSPKTMQGVGTNHTVTKDVKPKPTKPLTQAKATTQFRVCVTQHNHIPEKRPPQPLPAHASNLQADLLKQTELKRDSLAVPNNRFSVDKRGSKRDVYSEIDLPKADPRKPASNDSSVKVTDKQTDMIKKFLKDNPAIVGGLITKAQDRETDRLKALGKASNEAPEVGIKLSKRDFKQLPVSITYMSDGSIFVHAKTGKVDSAGKTHQLFLGKGAFKVVKVAVNLDTGEHVARATGKLTGETKDLAQIRNTRTEVNFYKVGKDHPNIAKAHTAMVVGSDRVAVMMSLYDGNLEDVFLKKKANIAPNKLPAMMSPMASSLNYMHSKGFVHRDIKLDNFVVKNDRTAPGGVKIFLGDPGMATTAPSRDGAQPPIGFGPYISPDLVNSKERTAMFNDLVAKELNGQPLEKLSPQEKGDLYEKVNRQILEKSDVYALGNAYFSMMNEGNTLPWVGGSMSDLEKMTSRKAQIAAGYAEPTNKKSLEHLVWEMVNPKTTERPSMSEVQSRLEALQAVPKRPRRGG